MLVDGLREHMPKSPLGQAWRDWENRASQLLEDIAPKMKSELRKRVDNALPPSACAYGKGFVESLWFAVTAVARSVSLTDIPYPAEKTEKGQNLLWGTYRLSMPLPDGSQRLDSLKQQHKRLLREVTAQEWVPKVRDALSGWGKARDSIQEEIAISLLRHVVPGRRKLCPQ